MLVSIVNGASIVCNRDPLVKHGTIVSHLNQARKGNFVSMHKNLKYCKQAIEFTLKNTNSGWARTTLFID